MGEVNGRESVQDVDYVKIVNKSQSAIQLSFQYLQYGSLNKSVVIPAGEYRIFQRLCKIFLVTETNLFFLCDLRPSGGVYLDELADRLSPNSTGPILRMAFTHEPPVKGYNFIGLRITFHDK